MLHVQHDYCSSFIQSDLCFLALPLSSCCFHYTIPDKTARKQILADRRLQSTKQPGFRFSKVPKLVEPISGATIPFIFLQRRGPKPSKFTILLVFFLTLKASYRSAFQKKKRIALGQLAFRAEKFSRLSRSRPQAWAARRALTSVR